MTIQIPPAVGSSGQFVEAVIVTSSQNRHVMTLGDALTSAYGPLTSSGGLLVALSNPSTAVTITNPTTQVNTLSSGPVLISGSVNVVSASSGLVQISGTPTVLTASSGFLVRSLSSGTVTLSSTPLVVVATSGGTFTVGTTGTLVIVSASSGLVQAIITGSSGVGALVSSAGSLQVITTASASGSTAVTIQGSTGSFATVTSSGALLISGPTGSGSTSVDIAALPPDIVGLGLTLTSSGPKTLGPFSVAFGFPTFGIQVTTAAGAWTGTIYSERSIDGTIFEINQASGNGDAYTAITTPGMYVSPIGAAQSVQVRTTGLTAGTATVNLSRSFGLQAVRLAAGLPSGTNTVGTVLTASSGYVGRFLSSGIVTLSSVHTVTATAAANPWSSAPSFNLPIVSVSSGLVQTLSSGPITGTVNTLSSGAILVLSSGPILLSTGGNTQAIVTGSSGVAALVSSGGSLQVITTASASGSTAVTIQGTTGVFATVTSSGALLVSGTPGSVSTAVNILATGGTFWAMTTQTGAMRVDPVGSYKLTGAYRVGSSFIVGSATRQNLVSIYCTTSQAANVAIKRVNIQQATTAIVAQLLTYQYVVGRASSSGAPTAGTVITQQKRQTADALSIAVVRSSPTTTMATGQMWADNPGTIMTGVGQLTQAPLIFGAEGREDDDVILTPGEALLIVAEANATTLKHSVDLSWVEFTT